MESEERRNSVTKPVIDRQKTTPFLLRLFVRPGGFHRLDEFESPDRLPVEDEVQIYTWKDVTLMEVGRLISSAFPQVSRPNTRLSFRLLYTDSYRGRVLLKDIGTVHMTPGQEGEDASSRTLEDVKYIIGDYVDVAIFGSGQGAPSRSFDGSRGSYSRQGGMDRSRGRGDSYRGPGRGRGGRNGFDGRLGGDGEDHGPPSGPRRDRDRDRDRW